MATSFLFWNVNRKPLLKMITDIVLSNNIDVLLLAENVLRPDQLLLSLNSEGAARYHYARGICDKIDVFARFKSTFIEPVSEEHRFTVRHLQLPGLLPVLLAVVHLPSKRNWSEYSQAVECRFLVKSILDAEEQAGHSRTVLVGDFNMNPFEEIVVGADGLNAVMTRSVAARGSRVVQAREYSFFYNPMWGLFGDISPGPAGTYYYSSSEHKTYFWNMFDQVLIRPTLLERFLTDELRILDSVGEQTLLSASGLPDKRIASDHLPLLWALSL